MRRGAADRGAGRRAVAIGRGLRRAGASLALAVCLVRPARAQDDAPRRLDVGRFTAVYFPDDDRLARTLLEGAARNDSFPWLPRPQQRVLIAIAPDARRFRQWAGPEAPEWGVALAFPASRRVILQGHAAGSEAGDPQETLRHELAHLALHERLGDRPPRWFDEGYASVAAHEWRRDDVLAANVALALRGVPSLDQLDQSFEQGTTAAQSAYALSYRAVTELASLDPERGLTLLFRYWENARNLDAAVRQAFGTTLSGFEKEFQHRTQRRYGALAVFADLSLMFLVTSVFILPFIVSRRARDRRRLREMLEADAIAERAERDAILAALLGIPAPVHDAGEAPGLPPSAPLSGDGHEPRPDASTDRSARRDDES
ncbi:MAG: hypothetical protein JF589_00850 [Gemmatimonadetes bacterium]|nr:hypothetical protein [Gemmatimonadota bacterium]